MGLLTLYFDITEELYDDLNAENIGVTLGKERFENCKFGYRDFILSTSVDVKNEDFDTIKIDRENAVERRSQIEVAAIFVAKKNQHWRKFVPKEENGIPYYSEVHTYELEFVTASSQNPSRAKALAMALYNSSGEPSNLIHLGRDVELISSRQQEQRYLVEVSKPNEIEYLKLFVDDLESSDWLLDHIIVHKISLNSFDQRKTYHKTFQYQPRYVRSKKGQQVITIYEDVVSSTSSSKSTSPDFEHLPPNVDSGKKSSKKKTKQPIRHDSFNSFSSLNTERDYTFVDLAKIRSGKVQEYPISTDDVSIIHLDPDYVSEAGDPPSCTTSVCSEPQVLPLRSPERNVKTNFSTVVLPTNFGRSGCQVAYQLTLRTGNNNKEVFLNRLYFRVLGDEGCTRRILIPLSTSTCFGKNSTANLSFHGKDVGNITGYELWTRTKDPYPKLDFDLLRIQRQSNAANRFEVRNVSYSRDRLHRGVMEGEYDHSDMRSEYSLAWSGANIQQSRARWRQVSSSSSSFESEAPKISTIAESISSESTVSFNFQENNVVKAAPIVPKPKSETPTIIESETSFCDQGTKPAVSFHQESSKATKFNWRGLKVERQRQDGFEKIPILIIVQNYKEIKQNIELYMVDYQQKKSKTYQVPVSKSACYRVKAQEKRFDRVKLACCQPQMAEYIPCMQIDDQLFIRRFKSNSSLSMPALYSPGTIYRVQAANTDSMNKISKDGALETDHGALKYWKNDPVSRRAYFFGPAELQEKDKIFLKSEFDDVISMRSYRTCSNVDSSGKMQWSEDHEIMRVAGTNDTYQRKIMARYKIAIAFNDSDPNRKALLKFTGTNYAFKYDLSKHHKENCLIEMEHFNIGFIHKVDIQTFSGGVREEKPANLIDYVFIQCNDQPGQFLTCPSDNFETLMPGYLFKVDLEAEKDYKGKMLNLRLVGQDGTDRFFSYPGDAFSKGETNLIFGGPSQFRELILTGEQGQKFPECFEEITISQAKTITYESDEGHEPDYKVVEVFNDLFNMKKGYADKTKTFLNLSGIQV